MMLIIICYSEVAVINVVELPKFIEKFPGNGKRQGGTFLAEFLLKFFISYFSSNVKKFIVPAVLKNLNPFALYNHLSLNVFLPAVCHKT